MKWGHHISMHAIVCIHVNFLFASNVRLLFCVLSLWLPLFFFRWSCWCCCCCYRCCCCVFILFLSMLYRRAVIKYWIWKFVFIRSVDTEANSVAAQQLTDRDFYCTARSGLKRIRSEVGNWQVPCSPIIICLDPSECVSCVSATLSLYLSIHLSRLVTYQNKDFGEKISDLSSWEHWTNKSIVQIKKNVVFVNFEIYPNLHTHLIYQTFTIVWTNFILIDNFICCWFFKVQCGISQWQENLKVSFTCFYGFLLLLLLGFGFVRFWNIRFSIDTFLLCHNQIIIHLAVSAKLLHSRRCHRRTCTFTLIKQDIIAFGIVWRWIFVCLLHSLFCVEFVLYLLRMHSDNLFARNYDHNNNRNT